MSLTSPSEKADEGAGLLARLPSASSWFVAFCMVLIAASLAAVVYLRFDMSLAEAGWIGLVALMIMVLAEFFTARQRERSAVEAQLREVETIAHQLARDVGRIEQQFGTLEASLTQRVDQSVAARLSQIDTRFTRADAALAELDEGLGDVELRLAELERVATRDPTPDDGVPGGRSEPVPDQREALETVEQAISADRIEVYLQPIVRLPQRRVRFYEALTRLRDADGRMIMPAGFLPVAEPAGLMPRIDNVALFRSVQVVRRMVRRSPDLAIFCNLSARSLVDAEFFPQFVDFIEQNSELANALVLEFPQALFSNIGPIEQAGLDALAALGFRFSVDHVETLDIDGSSLAARRVRFIKIDAPMLLNPPPNAPIHAADLARLLARSGIELIATHVETEAQLVDLLDFDIALGQGQLFSPPRAVRADILGDAGGPVSWARAS